MAYTLVGEVATNADTASDFTTINGGCNISGDDDFVQGTGAVGDKMSNTTETIASNNLTSTYNFSVGNTHEGWHVIGWFNTKTPVNSTGGLRIYAGNGTNSGTWYVDPTVFYKGGFVTKVIDTAADFDTVSGWSLTGNPAQLTAVTELGAQFNTTTSIMGSFNNTQADQFTVGLGVRADAGTVGTPNTFEGVRSTDEDTNFWGWWSSTQGAFIGKGKLYIGPATGSATSVFTDTAFSVIFADERVATGFYEIEMRGAGTDVTWDLGAISAANPTNARWSLTVDSTTNSFTESNSVWKGADVITLSANSDLTNTTFVDSTDIIQNGATMDGITLLDANVAAGEAAILSDNPGLISNGTFTSSGNGHAIEIDTAGTYTFTGNNFSTYSTVTDNDKAIWFNPTGGTGDLVLNVSGSSNLTASMIRNSSSGSVTVNNNTTVTLTGMKNNTEVRVYATGTATELAGIEDATAGTDNARTFSFSLAATTVVDLVIFNKNWVVPPANRIDGYTVPSTDTSLPITQIADRTFSNP